MPCCCVVLMSQRQLVKACPIPSSDLVSASPAHHHMQTDNHLGNLTVQETLMFAHTCLQGNTPCAYDVHHQIIESKAARSIKDLQQLRTASASSQGSASGAAGAAAGDEAAAAARARAEAIKSAVRAQLEEDEVEALIRDLCGGSGLRVELLLRWMGLAHVRNSLVGDAMVRGLSGGEKKRLTCAEMIVGQRRVLMLLSWVWCEACVVLMLEITLSAFLLWTFAHI